MSDALLHPDQRTVIVVSQGKAYRVDPEAKSLAPFVGDCVDIAATSPDAKLVVLADMATVWLVHEDDRVVRLDFVSYPGPSDFGFSDRFVYGVGTCPETNGEFLFAIERDTGAMIGGIKAVSDTLRRNSLHFALRDQRALLTFTALVLLTVLIVFLGWR